MPLNILKSLEKHPKNPRIKHRSMYMQRKEKKLFWQINKKTQIQKFSEVSANSQDSKVKQAIEGLEGLSKMQDFHFGSLNCHNSNSPTYLYPDFHIGSSPKLQNLKRYRICYNKRTMMPNIDSALMISKKKITPSVSNRAQFLSF